MLSLSEQVASAFEHSDTSEHGIKTNSSQIEYLLTHLFPHIF
jgi:hypothetical protein